MLRNQTASLTSHSYSACATLLRMRSTDTQVHHIRWSNMAAAPGSVGRASARENSSSVVAAFDLSEPPVIDGFSPLPRPREEGFRDKFIRKTKENPFVPIGKLQTNKTTSFSLIKTPRLLLVLITL